MLVHVDPNSGVPVYKQIVLQIRFHIASGLLGYGDVLPSTREISDELGINPMTVSKAFGILEQEGLLEHRPGKQLSVARVNRSNMEAQREEQVRRMLEPIAAAVEQLGFPTSRAVAVFREILLSRNARATRRKHA